MTNKKTNETAETIEVTTNNNNDDVIKDLKAQVALLTEMITSKSQKNEDAENAFFKQKSVTFTVTTFKEPDKAPEVKEIKVK